jgi:acetylcholinesterase
MMLPSFYAACLFGIATAASRAPVVRSKAGIFHGRHLPGFDQDVYLGIKYAPKPERFAPAKLAGDAPSTDFNATQYGVDCTGYGSDTNALVAGGWTTLGEDCLHLNIIKPRVKDRSEGMPVLLWIYGGGWQQGATSDPRYTIQQVK